MVITGKSKLDKQQFGWIYFINHFREQFKKMPKELSFTDEEIPFFTETKPSFGWEKAGTKKILKKARKANFLAVKAKVGVFIILLSA